MSVAASQKDQQKRHWDAVAEGWGTWLGWTERQFAPLTAWLAAAAGWMPGARALDIGCGAGYPALAAARAVTPGGRVTATDFSPPMVETAARAARAAGLDNIDFETMDAEALRFEDGAFAAATNAYGLMFCPDPARAVAEAHRVLARGGRFALAVWDEPAKNPFMTTIRGPAERFLELAPPDPAAPGPFRLASLTEVRSLLERAGFRSVRVESLPMTFECESAAEYCQIFTDYAWKSRVAALGEQDARRFREAVAEAARPFQDRGRVRLVSTSICAAGEK